MMGDPTDEQNHERRAKGGLSAQKNAQAVIDAIAGINNKVQYAYAEAPLPKDNIDGGMEGSNIRNGFFYRTDRVSLREQELREQDNNPARLESNAENNSFERTRKPVLASFTDNTTNETYHLINVHLKARKRKERLSGHPQSEAKLSRVNEVRDAQRAKQVAFVAGQVKELMDAINGHEREHVGVLGDFNTADQSALQPLSDAGLVEASDSIREEPSRFYRNGKAIEGEAIDHLFVSPNMKERMGKITRHMLNQGTMPDAFSDHNPLTASINAPEITRSPATEPER